MNDRRRVLTAYQHRSITTFFGALTLIATAGWAGQHALHAMNIGTGQGSRLAVVWIATFSMLAAQVVLYHLERPPKATPRALRQLAGQHVAIVVPVYNEDPGYLRMMLESFIQQTRTPNAVHVVDDGSTSGDYAEVRDWWWHASAAAGIAASWQRTPNEGKRHAQAVAVRCADEADIIITVDSDSYLAPTAVEEVVKPFVKAKVQSVAGIVMATNNRGPGRPAVPEQPVPGGATTGRKEKREMRGWRRRRRTALRQWRGQKLLSRITDLWFVTGQLCDRSSQSAIGSVLVNSGPLAAYRADVVRDNLDAYLDEWFMGRRVMFSDDSLLTLYARMRGTTVQNPRAVVFSAMPEKTSHLHRMYLRWMRGSTIRSLWRIRYLPATSPAFWFQAFRWFQVALSTMIIGWLLLVEPLVYRDAPPVSFLFVPFLIGYAQGLRYLSVFRSDERLRSRALTWLMMPLAVVWAWTALRWLRWYGAATCARTGWGTRQDGAEVSLDSPVQDKPAMAGTAA